MFFSEKRRSGLFPRDEPQDGDKKPGGEGDASQIEEKVIDRTVRVAELEAEAFFQGIKEPDPPAVEEIEEDVGGHSDGEGQECRTKGGIEYGAEEPEAEEGVHKGAVWGAHPVGAQEDEEHERQKQPLIIGMIKRDVPVKKQPSSGDECRQNGRDGGDGGGGPPSGCGAGVNVADHGSCGGGSHAQQDGAGAGGLEQEQSGGLSADKMGFSGHEIVLSKSE